VRSYQKLTLTSFLQYQRYDTIRFNNNTYGTGDNGICMAYSLTVHSNREQMEELIKELGFESLEEWSLLISNVDLSDGKKLMAFEIWRHEDGTKEGLLKLK